MTGNTQSLQSFVDTAIVPIGQIGVADLHAGATRFDGWLRDISGSWLTLDRLQEVAGSLPVLGNIMAAVDLCGDVVTMYEERGRQRSTLESTLAWAELGIDLIGSLPAPGTGPARMTLRPALAVIRQAVKHEVKEVPAAVAAVLVSHFSSTLMGELSQFAEGAIARLESFLQDSAAKIAAILTELAQVLHALAAGDLLRPDENLNRAGADLAELRRDPLHQYEKLFSAVWEAYKAGVKGEVNAVVQLTTGALGKARMTQAAEWLERMVPVARREILALAAPDNIASILSMLRMLQLAARLYEKHKHSVAATVHATKPNQATLKHRGEAVEPVKDQAKARKPGASDCVACRIGQPANRGPHAISYALGDESFTHTDFVLPGIVPIEWARTYHSNFGAHDEAAPLGPRWTTPYHVSFESRGDGWLYHDASGRSIEYPAFTPFEPHHDRVESCVLSRRADGAIQVVRAETITETYVQHGANFRLARIEDRSSNAATLAWDNDRLVSVTSSTGAVARLSYDEAGRVTRIEQLDDEGSARPLAHYRYDEADDLAEATDEDSASWHYAYSHHLITRYTDRTGRGMNLEWDGTHLDAKAIHEWADDGTFDLRLTWHDRLRLTFVTDALGNTTQQYYDIDGYLYRTVNPDHTEEWFFRDAAKRVTQHVLPDGTQESFTWDDDGHLTSHTTQDGRTAHYVYDQRGDLTGQQDPEGHRWQRYYDSKGRVTEATDPLGHVTHYQYNDAGLPVAITDPNGGTKKLSWRADGQLESYTDCSGKTARWKYDERGRLVQHQNAAGETTRYGYEAGQLAWTIGPDGSRETFERDAEGRLLTHTDALNRQTHYRYSRAGLLTQRINANGDALEYGWNPLGQLTLLRNENGREYTFDYDSFGRLAVEYDFDGQATQYFRDARTGQIGHRLAGGVMQQFGYDAMGRLAQRSGWPARYGERNTVYLAPPKDGKVEHESFDYDGFGRLTTARNDRALVRRVHDAVGNLVREHINPSFDENGAVVPAGTPRPEWIWQHEYDEIGARIATIRPDGRRLDWLTYGSGHVHGLLLDGNTVASFERDDAHRETSREIGNGLKQLTQYDAAGRLARQTLQGTGGKVVERRYQYDQAGRLTQIADLRRGAIQYAYDPLDRLTRAQSTLGVETFAFDPASNIVEATERDQHGIGTEGGRRTAPLLDNLLKQYAGTHFDYDERGNLTRRTHNGESTQFEWNALGRMTGAVNRHMRATYAYDALGRRIAKYTEAQVAPLPMAGSGWRDAERARLAREHGYGLTLYGWDGDRLAYETVGVRREIVHYVYEPDSFTPLARMSVPMDRAEAEQSTAPSLAYYHCDQIGTPQELTDEAGEVAWSARYRAWGAAQEVISEAARKAGITSPLRFAGQYFDRETGLHYNRHRYYDPNSGRFVSKDPIGLDGGINVFQYAPNPTQWIDPLGLAKRGPKTGGCGPHNEMIAAWGREIQAAGGTLTAGGGQFPEQVVETTGGFKNGRRPDIIYTDSENRAIYGQVGRVRADGVTPVTREQQAMDDLRTKTQGDDIPDEVEFRAYNCCHCSRK
ncbi:RHS repeat-associated core domain-containing protein [Burkholderia plantarii]|uniref:YD repeat protein n=1 Tax=Burkholderia plantarii TaxID=41899 RepID=A0A0B6RUE2_BURPL|nr:RHS repeat-associated core domain-containing protein [Burkholderia plantarii]AJK48947.1 YD repeat protein [Burkholderia plantarii]